MPIFGVKSKNNLATCCPELQLICNKAILIYDFSVIWGIRGKEIQNRLFHQGLSKVQWPFSAHNIVDKETLEYLIRQGVTAATLPFETDKSDAVDVVPWPINWNDRYRFIYLAGIMDTIAHGEGIKLRWGGNWDGDHIIITDQTFIDLGHYEVIRG